jgi:hypothetical protein
LQLEQRMGFWSLFSISFTRFGWQMKGLLMEMKSACPLSSTLSLVANDLEIQIRRRLKNLS